MSRVCRGDEAGLATLYIIWLEFVTYARACVSACVIYSNTAGGQTCKVLTEGVSCFPRVPILYLHVREW